MPASARYRKPLWVRAASRTAGLFGVRFYNMLYGECSLVGEIRQVDPPPGLEIQPTRPRDVELLLSKLSQAQADWCRIAAGLESRCFVALDGQEIAGFSWFNTQYIYMLRSRVHALPPEGAYTYNSWVRPEYRGQKIFQCLTRTVYSELKKESFEFCCNLVDRSNAPSVAARRRLGAQFHAAPILELPGLNPLPLRRLPFGVSVGASQSL